MDNSKLDKIAAEARRNREQRENSYRDKSLKMYPWICGRCSREFTRENVRELTVHHRDHNHDNNPEDGSNWELLCVYCHDNEHSRYEDNVFAANSESGLSSTSSQGTPPSGNNAFANLKDLLNTKPTKS